MEYVQKAAPDPLLWAYAENCESDYRCGFCLHFKPLKQFHSLSTLTENIWIKHKIVSSNTYKLIQLLEVRSKETLPPISVSLLEGMRGENKINGLNFILANQIPIKLKEKLKTGQCEH